MLSLYDYLGKAGGTVLGDKVNAYAQIRKQPFKQRYVENSAYKGNVFLYTKDFLDEYFEIAKIFNTELIAE